MCGIFGLVISHNASKERIDRKKLIRKLFVLSESRGKESSGLFVTTGSHSYLLKAAYPPSELLKNSDFQKIERNFQAKNAEYLSIICHSRLVTNGRSEDNRNNQPVVVDDLALVHNGIICNTTELTNDYAPPLNPISDLDSEVLGLALAREMLHASPLEAVAKIFEKIEGSASIALQMRAKSLTLLATNTGSLYYAELNDHTLVFASESFILNKALDECVENKSEVKKLPPHSYIIADDRKIHFFGPQGAANYQPDRLARVRDLTDLSAYQTKPTSKALTGLSDFEKAVQYDEKLLKSLRRCSQCILPESFPGIHFDGMGVCNLCKNYVPRPKLLGETALTQKIQQYRKTNIEDCLVAFSGGRDSSYGLYYLKEKMGISPVTFTYDWGMVSDLARRNIARVCGQLGIENILVSADIRAKRENIKKNVSAWLKSPDLGMVPLFMAGDKQFFHFNNVIKKQCEISLDIWMMNWLENTNFKSGFAGVRHDKDKKNVDGLPLLGHLKLPSYYLTQFLRNPAYLNSSLRDTFSAYLSYYFAKREDHILLFDYIPWVEDEVDNTLRSFFDWETSSDSPSLWRIGDGTAPFYNYIYVTMAGFSEFDTFRSNQIREGSITRERALELVFQENRPRIPSLLWYLETIGLDPLSTVRRINEFKLRFSQVEKPLISF